MIDKNWIKSEIKVVACLTFATFSLDGAAILLKIYNGDYSKPVLFSAGLILFQSFVRAVLTLCFPELFKHGSQINSNNGEA